MGITGPDSIVVEGNLGCGSAFILDGIGGGVKSCAGGEESIGGCNPSAPIGSGAEGCASTGNDENIKPKLYTRYQKNGEICIEPFKIITKTGILHIFFTYNNLLIIYEF
jgi:hypothetical protein